MNCKPQSYPISQHNSYKYALKNSFIREIVYEMESLTHLQKEIQNNENIDCNREEQMTLRNRKKESQVLISSSSVKSNQSDSSNSDYVVKFERKTSLQEIIEKDEDKSMPTQCQRHRSNSDGAAWRLRHQNTDFEVFPRERLSEEELEQKFTSLALAFTIDATTVKNRCKRQRRSRDQNELNLSKEIERFKEKLVNMQPLCTDSEKAELLSSLMTQIDVIMQATSLVSTSAEKYGSVQHEETLTESVDLMVNHVQVLKQQRDSARRQLIYTKRVSQNSPDSCPSSPGQSPSLLNRKISTQRRGSLNAINKPVADMLPDMKKITRRTSDISMRASSVLRNVRPSRLDLGVGVDLVGIREGIVEQRLPDIEKTSEIESENEVEVSNADGILSAEEVKFSSDSSKLSLRERIHIRFSRAQRSMEDVYEKWTIEGNVHETCRFCALLCFSLGLIILVNIYIEFELTK